MEFLKKNYEKVVLGVVLLGLTAAVAMLPFIISSKREKLESLRITLTNPKIKDLPAQDLSPQEAAVQRLQNAYNLDLTKDHNLYNPVTWIKGPDNRPVKVVAGLPTGPESLEVTAIKPLELILNFDGVSGTSYLIGITNQAARNPRERAYEKSLSRGNNNKNDLINIVDVHGPEDKPTEVVLKLTDDGQIAVVGPGKAFSRIQGHAVDMKYTAGNGKIWHDQRLGATLVFGDGSYNIVAITETNITVESRQNSKKTTITFKPPTEPR